MNLDLMPYRLNSDFKEVANQVNYIDSYNGAKLYKANTAGFVLPGIPVTDVHLYFIEDILITIYLHLENSLEHIDSLVNAITQQLGMKGVLSRSQFGLRYRWEAEDEVLVLVKDQIHRKFYVYYALAKYSVF